MRKYSNLTFKVILSILLAFCVFKITTIYADSVVFKITGISVKDKSAGVVVNDVNINNDSITNDVEFSDLNDYIKYNVTLKNNSSDNYIIKSITDDNSSIYLKYEYDSLADVVVAGGAEKTFELTITYFKQASDPNLSTGSVTLTIIYEKENGDTEEQAVPIIDGDTNKDSTNNPKTNDDIMLYVILGSASLIGIIVLCKTKSKSKHLVIISLLILPLCVKANTIKLTIRFNNTIKASSYNVSVDLGSGTEEFYASIAKGGKVTRPENPSKRGYTFDDWYLGSNVYDFDTPVTGPITLEPRFNIDTYTLSYDLDGGSLSTTNPNNYNVNDDITLYNPIKLGYSFEGWQLSGTTSVVNPLRIFDEVGNKTYKAIYTPNNYTITFNSNNASSTEVAVQNMVYDSSINLEKNTFVYPGYSFVSWNTQSDGNGIDYGDEENVINLATSGSVDLYAIWEANDDTLYRTIHRYEQLDGTFEEVTVNGYGTTDTPVTPSILPRDGYILPTPSNINISGSGNAVQTYTYMLQDCTVTYNEDVVTTFTNPFYKYGTSITVSPVEKTGYTFIKWSDNSTTKNYTFEIHGNITIYPIYEANKYNVVFNSNTSQNETSTQEFTYDVSGSLNANSFSNAGHSFIKWNTQSDGNGIDYSNEESVINLATSGEFNLYAIWSPDTYIINFDSAGGSSVDSITREYNEALGTLVKPRKEGFRFVGWFTDPDNGEEVTASTLVSGSTTYYAHWEVQETLCKKSQTLHTQVCNSASNKGCKLMGYTATGAMGTDIITYGQVAYNYNPGDVYNCDVNGDGIYSDETERFYYIRTLNNKAVLIYDNNFDTDGNVNNSVIYDYETSKGILPTSIIWSNVPEISDGVITRFPNEDDIYAACPGCNLQSNYALSDCIFLLENTKFANSNDQYGRSAVWMEKVIRNENVVLKRYRGDTYNLQEVTEESSSGVRPVIEVSLQYMDTANTVKFDLNGGTGNANTRIINDGSKLGSLPSDISKENALFDGWFTSPTGGTQIDENEIPSSDITYYAHFTTTIAGAIIPNETIVIHPGETDTIHIGYGSDTGESYSFASANESIATVDDSGNVTAVSVGHTNVIITGLRSGETRIISITVLSDANTYAVNFDTNGGNIIDPITVTAGSEVGSLPTPEKSDNLFDAWYLDQELTNIADEHTIVNDSITLYAKWYSVNSVAKIGHNYYLDIKSAVEGVPLNNIKTEILVLRDFSSSETAVVVDDQVVDFNLDGHTYTFTSTGSTNVFTVTGGELYVSNGTITGGPTSGLIDVNEGKKLYIDGATISATNTKQAVYNNGGTVTITGNSYLSATAKDRPALHNLNNGIIYIQSATIISTGSNQSTTTVKAAHAVANEAGAIYIGVDGGVPSTSNPYIKGNSTGVYGNGIYFYDGHVEGKKASFNSMPDASHIQSGTQIVTGIDGDFKTAELDVSGYLITLNSNSGESTPSILTVTPGEALENLPTPVREHHHFDGWFTDAEGGEEVTNSTIPSGNVEYFAHWTYVSSDEIVSFRTTNDAMKTYYSYIDDWKDDASNFPTWSSDNKSPNWALDATENTVMMQNFNANNCMCADGQCLASGTVECDKPNGYKTGFNESVTVRLSDDTTKTKTGEIVKYAKSNEGVIYNLIPEQVYYWELDSDSSIYGYVKFTGERRIIDAGDVRNVRDLGGLPVDTDGDTIVDGHLAYCRLFRGIRLSSSNSVNELTNLGVNSELDLREANSDSNKIDRYTRIEAQNYYVKYGTTNPNESTYYQMTRNAVKFAMEEIVNDKNLYFHCRIGTDRTGTVAYVLEGILGVPEEDRIRDYELSFFYGLVRIHRYHNEKPGSSVGTGKERFVYMHDFMPSNEDIVNWYMAGSTNTVEDQALIEQFRAKMIVTD